MKRFCFIIAAVVLAAALTSAKPNNNRQVTYVTSIECKKCVEKVKENISFEKGVVDLDVKLEDRTVKIVYSPAKTDTLKLGNAIRKLGYTAKAIEDRPQSK